MLAPLRGHHSAANSRMDLHEAVAATAAAAAATVGAFGRPVPTARVSVLPGPPPSMELRGCRYWDSSVPCRAGQAADRMIASANPPALQRSGRLTIPNYQSKRCLCLSQGVEGRSSSLLHLLLRLLFVLVVLVSTVAPGIDARRQQRGSQSDVAATVPTASVNCQPVPYDSLWQRLDLYHHPHRHHSHSRDRRQPSRRTRSGESPLVGDTLRWKRSVADLTPPPPPPTTTERPGPRNATEAGGVRSKPDHRIRQHRRKRKRLPGGDRTARREEEEGHREEEEEGDTPDHQRELWQCDMTTKWKKMARGTFPPYVQTGRCRQTKCMLGVYECKARRYLVKVMKRVDAACLPVPSIGVNSTYEEAWVFSDVKVTVGCDCVLRNPGHYVITKTGS